MPNEGGDRTDDLPASDPPAFRLDGCRVEPALNRVVKGRSVIQVEPKVMAVLLQLVARRGGVCSRRELMERVWADIHVGEDVLTRSVAELRRIFDDDPREPRVIDTIRKRGYRLIPEPVFDGSPGAGVRDPATEPPSRRALTWARLLARLALAAGMAAVVVGLALTLPGSREPTHAERRDDPAPAPRLARLTSRPGTERDPAVSPDGTRVAYTVFEPSGSVAHLFVQSRGAEDRLRLTSGLFEDRYPAWSSDGTRLAFVRRSPEGCHLHIVSALGGAERRVATCDRDATRHLAWSPDDRALVLSAWSEKRRRVSLFLLDLGSLEVRRLTRPKDPYRADLEPAFSPDGRQIAFTRSVGGVVSELWVQDVDSGLERRLTFDSRDIVGSGWSRDGRSLVFASNRGGTYALWQVPAAGGEPRWLTGGGTKIKHPSLARGADVLAFEDWRFEINVWRIELEGAETGREEPVVVSTEWDYAPDVDPRGERLAFLSTRSGESAVWLSELGGQPDGSEVPPLRVTPSELQVLSVPRWSPDGERLTFVAFADGQVDVYVTRGDGPAPLQVTNDAAREIAPTWSPDGSSLVFGVEREGEWHLSRLEMATGARTTLGPTGAYAAQEAPDGTLYYLRADRRGLWRLPLGSGQAELVSSELGPQNRADWVLRPQGVYYLVYAPQEGAHLLRFVSATDREPRTLGVVPETARPGIAVSGDGRSVFVSRTDNAACDLMVAENLL